MFDGDINDVAHRTVQVAHVARYPGVVVRKDACVQKHRHGHQTTSVRTVGRRGMLGLHRSDAHLMPRGPRDKDTGDDRQQADQMRKTDEVMVDHS